MPKNHKKCGELLADLDKIRQNKKDLDIAVEDALKLDPQKEWDIDSHAVLELAHWSRLEMENELEQLEDKLESIGWDPMNLDLLSPMVVSDHIYSLPTKFGKLEYMNYLRGNLQKINEENRDAIAHELTNKSFSYSEAFTVEKLGDLISIAKDALISGQVDHLYLTECMFCCSNHSSYRIFTKPPIIRVAGHPDTKDNSDTLLARVYDERKLQLMDTAKQITDNFEVVSSSGGGKVVELMPPSKP